MQIGPILRSPIAAVFVAALLWLNVAVWEGAVRIGHDDRFWFQMFNLAAITYIAIQFGGPRRFLALTALTMASIVIVALVPNPFLWR